MSDVADALAVLQFGDSFFPSGAVSFSWGLEGLSDSGVVTDADAVRAFVIGQLARPLGRVRPTGGRGGAPGADRASKTSPPSTLRSRCKRPCAELRSGLAADGRGHAVGVRQARHRRGCRLSREGEAGRSVRASCRDARLSVGARRLKRAGRRRSIGAYLLHRVCSAPASDLAASAISTRSRS